MKKLLPIILAVLVMFTLASCSKNSFDNAVGGGESAGSNSYPGAVEDKGDSLIENENRKIIKYVNESVQTDGYDEFMESLHEAITACGGYISSANYSGESYYSNANLRYANLVVRIPSQRLSEFTDSVDSLAVVTYYNEYIQDVTTAYVDAESKIAVLEAEEEALLEILKKSATTSDALAVRTRLVEVQGDLASLRAQIKSYDNLVEYSTVTLRINEVRRVVVTNPSFKDEVSAEFADSIYTLGEGIRAFFVWFFGNIISIILLGAILTGAVFFVRFATRKIRARKSGRKSGKTEDFENTAE